MRRRRGDGVERVLQILLGAAVVALMGWVTLEQRGTPHAHAVADAGVSAPGPLAMGAEDAGASAAPEDAGLAMALPFDAGILEMPLPSGGPRALHLGVVLVAFAGAEGAPPNARGKADALKVAQGLSEVAHVDFHRAVTSGDTGSSDDIGRIPRGVLDPHTEAVVFRLAALEVSEIMETPKGYWIVKRLE